MLDVDRPISIEELREIGEILGNPSQIKLAYDASERIRPLEEISQTIFGDSVSFPQNRDRMTTTILSASNEAQGIDMEKILEIYGKCVQNLGSMAPVILSQDNDIFTLSEYDENSKGIERDTAVSIEGIKWWEPNRRLSIILRPWSIAVQGPYNNQLGKLFEYTTSNSILCTYANSRPFDRPNPFDSW
jgi:hypothetical protein